MPLPHPGLEAIPFTPLTAEFIDDMNDNIESLANGTGFNPGALVWEEIARVTLTSNSADIVASWTGNPRKYIKVILGIRAFSATPTAVNLRLNNDYGNNYAHRVTTFASTYTSTPATSQVSFPFIGGASWPAGVQVEVDILDNPSRPKHVSGNVTWHVGNNAATGDSLMRSIVGTHFQTANRVESVRFTTAGGTMGVDTDLIVLGRN